MPAPALPAVAVSSADPQRRARLREVQFGDGYKQAAPDGLNSVETSYRMRWQAVSAADAASLDAFFTARRGSEPFSWRPDGEPAALLWRCKRWRVARIKGGPLRTVTATFERFFGSVP